MLILISFLNQTNCLHKQKLGVGFKYFLFSPLIIWGRFPIWRAYFSDGLVQPPTRKSTENSLAFSAPIPRRWLSRFAVEASTHSGSTLKKIGKVFSLKRKGPLGVSTPKIGGCFCFPPQKWIGEKNGNWNPMKKWDDLGGKNHPYFLGWKHPCHHLRIIHFQGRLLLNFGGVTVFSLLFCWTAWGLTWPLPLLPFFLKWKRNDIVWQVWISCYFFSCLLHCGTC